MNKTNTQFSDAIKIIFQGALGSLTFGAYHQYTTTKMMEMNNELIRLQNKYELDKMKIEHEKQLELIEIENKKQLELIRIENEKLNEKITKLDIKYSNRWF
jgi:hypothetical protein